jgi:hypothetical protein
MQRHSFEIGDDLYDTIAAPSALANFPLEPSPMLECLTCNEVIKMIHKTRLRFLGLLAFVAISFPARLAPAQENATVARLVVWQPKPGMERDFEEGYKRHLGWHRRNADTWTWYGWTVADGENPGYFVDGTFFHSWPDFDSPVNPAADAADNAVNVYAYAVVRSVAAYEAVPALTNLGPQQLTSPLLTFYYLDVQPGRAAEFESILATEFRTTQASSVKRAVLRPANGVTEYLVLLPAGKQSDLGPQAEFVTRLLQAVARDKKGDIVVAHVRTVTAHFRPELSYTPTEKPK